MIQRRRNPLITANNFSKKKCNDLIKHDTTLGSLHDIKALHVHMSTKVSRHEQRSREHCTLSECECVAGCVTVGTERTAVQAYG